MLGNWNREEGTMPSSSLSAAIRSLGGDPNRTPWNGLVVWEDGIFGWQAHKMVGNHMMLSADGLHVASHLVVAHIDQTSRKALLDPHITWKITMNECKIITPQNSVTLAEKTTFQWLENIQRQFELREAEIKCQQEYVREQMRKLYETPRLSDVKRPPWLSTQLPCTIEPIKSLREGVTAPLPYLDGFPSKPTPSLSP